MLVVTATLKAKPGRGEELEKMFQKVLPVFRQEAGIITFKVHRGLDDPDAFFFFEQYRSQADLDAHFAQPHFKTFARATADLVEGRPQITLSWEGREI